ncbi:MAG: 50S ribosomal protein L23 [Omnitrophica WOR_2 bacterium RIFCSPHIGHO2_01_FULL_48_9]|nr:MAG: 50S ribosomal protein L23 [Omnitrophica WOR_2 bacterium RIFCSPHIGHO2_02_FULL_48_11]OGX33312.1 MAG: 50S ribosomal protein L23 [Omnitrophica WOR_2 bacterium RIFCSPHIGHO2_01_FULL_48_9]
MTAYDIVKTLLRTEKGSSQEPQRKYLFQVFRRANKIQIRRAVEEIYKVKVEAVNTAIAAGKRKRVRQEFGHTSDWKKAVVTLQDGFKIDVT